jgi:hypothetical protein
MSVSLKWEAVKLGAAIGGFNSVGNSAFQGNSQRQGNTFGF